MKGNFHVRFLEGGGLVTALCYSARWFAKKRFISLVFCQGLTSCSFESSLVLVLGIFMLGLNFVQGVGALFLF
jgi:hypothetical protein